MQAEGVVIFRGGEDFVDVLIDEFLVDDAVLRVPLGSPKGGADGVDLPLKVGGAAALGGQLCQLLFGGFQLGGALGVHVEKIPVGERSLGVEGEQLLLFLLDGVHGAPKGFHPAVQAVTLMELLVHLDIFLNQGFQLGLGQLEHLQQQGL